MNFRMFRSAVIAIPPSYITTLLCSLSIVFVFLYIYFVASSVLNVVVRKEADNSKATLQSEIAVLETSIIAAQHTISERLASLDGFTADENKIFVTREVASNLVLGTNN